MIGIIGAMETEVEFLYSQLQEKSVQKYAFLDFYVGKLFNKDVVIVKSGVGKVNSALCAQLLITNFNVKTIINTGIAGATGKGLGVFDFVVSTKAVYHDVDVQIFGYKKGQIPGCSQEFLADEKLVQKAKEVFLKTEFSKEHQIKEGVIASGDQFISNKDIKTQIISDFSPMCVEMEGASIAHACTLNNVPFVIIRCMSDCADDSANNTYEFNEDICAKMCSTLVLQLIQNV